MVAGNSEWNANWRGGEALKRGEKQNPVRHDFFVSILFMESARQTTAGHEPINNFNKFLMPLVKQPAIISKQFDSATSKIVFLPNCHC